MGMLEINVLCKLILSWTWTLFQTTQLQQSATRFFKEFNWTLIQHNHSIEIRACLGFRKWGPFHLSPLRIAQREKGGIPCYVSPSLAHGHGWFGLVKFGKSTCMHPRLKSIKCENWNLLSWAYLRIWCPGPSMVDSVGWVVSRFHQSNLFQLAPVWLHTLSGSLALSFHFPAFTLIQSLDQINIDRNVLLNQVAHM